MLLPVNGDWKSTDTDRWGSDRNFSSLSIQCWRRCAPMYGHCAKSNFDSSKTSVADQWQNQHFWWRLMVRNWSGCREGQNPRGDVSQMQWNHVETRREQLLLLFTVIGCFWLFLHSVDRARITGVGYRFDRCLQLLVMWPGLGTTVESSLSSSLTRFRLTLGTSLSISKYIGLGQKVKIYRVDIT